MARAEIVENGDQVELVVTEAAGGQVYRFDLVDLTVGLLAETAARAAANALRRRGERRSENCPISCGLSAAPSER